MKNKNNYLTDPSLLNLQALATAILINPDVVTFHAFCDLLQEMGFSGVVKYHKKCMDGLILGEMGVGCYFLESVARGCGFLDEYNVSESRDDNLMNYLREEESYHMVKINH